MVPTVEIERKISRLFHRARVQKILDIISRHTRLLVP